MDAAEMGPTLDLLRICTTHKSSFISKILSRKHDKSKIINRKHSKVQMKDFYDQFETIFFGVISKNCFSTALGAWTAAHPTLISLIHI
jgi:hypothetical protein